MKPSPYILYLLLLIPEILEAQIVIDQTDMPSAGDTLRVSITSSVPGDYSNTGSGITWDFSMLEPMNQRVDTFVSAASTPPEYWWFFVPGVVSNLANPKGSSEFFPGLPVNQFYTFYKKTSDAFVDNGFAFKVMGVTFPAKYNSPDKYYTLPMDTNSTWASASSVTFESPGMFFFSTQRTRTSFVDGWGTVITPFGSFASLRVRSDLVQRDSIFIDSLGFGIGLNRNVTEYKWMAENMGIPVLQVNNEGLLTTATYRDSTRLSNVPLTVTLGPDTTVIKGAIITLFASVTGGAPPYRFFWNTLDTSQALTVTMDTTRSFGVVVIDGLNTFASDQKLITVVSPGIEEKNTRLLIVYPNPSEGVIQISPPDNFRSGEVLLFDWSGKEILSQTITGPAELLELDLRKFPAGMYTLHLITEKKLYQGKIILIK
ncbi:MAG: T9SS type A sorting domain-containing protein [Bacteroidales bacterium]|nr:T9SS type A sorting domain-containing protein [Bacteroidales bacterium]